MPALAAPLIGFALGVVFAWAAGDDAPRLSQRTGARGYLSCLGFGALVFAPAAGYLLAFYPDWSYAYWIASERIGTAPELVLVLVNAGAPAAGFHAARALSSSRDGVPVLRVAGLPALGAAALLLSHAGRLRTFGTYAQYHGDFGLEPVAGSPLGYAILLVGCVVLLGTAWTARYLSQVASRPGD